MRSLVIAGLDPAIQFLDQSVKDWMPRSSRGMTWVGVGATWYNQDPNEIFLLAVVMSILGLVGGAFLLSGVIFLRNRGSFFFQVHKVTWLLIAGVAILIACAVVSFIPPPNGVNYPELRLLLIPAVVLAWSIYVMRSVPTTQPRDQRGE